MASLAFVRLHVSLEYGEIREYGETRREVAEIGSYGEGPHSRAIAHPTKL